MPASRPRRPLQKEPFDPDMRRPSLPFVVSLCTVLVMAAATLAAPSAAAADLAGLLRERLEQPAPLQAHDEPIIEHTLLRHLYRRNDYRPLWTGTRGITALRQWIDRSMEEGLNPDDYHRAALRVLLDGGPVEGPDAVDLELLLSDAMLLLGVHLGTGKVDAARLFREWNYLPDADRAPTSTEVLESLRAGRIGELLAARVPDGPIYRTLRAALARYRAIRDRGGWPLLPAGPALHPGDCSPRVALLRERLARESGDASLEGGDAACFDAVLEQAVRHFQRLHLLEEDGVVGRKTLAELNVPVHERIDQLRVNLERIRWLHHGLPEDFYAADLAGFRLYHRQGWSSPIVVGKAYHQTPAFHDLIEIVEINPTWTVPRSITVREILPELLRDPPGYLRRKDMELLTMRGEPVDPATVDWSALGPLNFPYVLRQRPGPDNALGRIKFLFPNPYSVYLHDTPARELFRHPRRAFSHGCIRVAKAVELGERLLRGNGPQWTAAYIRELIDAGETVRVRLAQPVPILIVYLTAMPDLIGGTDAIQFREDIYRRDPRVLAELDAPPRERGAALLEEYRRQRGTEW
ncbi:MAG: murein L,D-transpeptidase [Gammaproteobacteria bacterium]|nr:MAG: murein L,D-transpeptidase [Gammaproteobacteria bacterium]